MTESHDLRERGSCRSEDETVWDVAEEDPEEGEGDDEMQDLLEAMRNLTEVYSALAATNKLCNEIIPKGDEKAPLEPSATVTTKSSTGTIASCLVAI